MYHSLGENSLAEAYFEKALRLHQVNYGDQELGIVQPLAHLAEAKRSLEKFEEADSLFTKAYLLQTKFDNENIKGLADLESQIGELHEDRQNFSKAEKWYVQALNRYQKIGVTGTTMVDETKTSLGKTYAKQGRTDEALKLHEEVLDSYRKKYQKGSLYIAGKWNRISETYRIAEDWEKALAYSDSTFFGIIAIAHFTQFQLDRRFTDIYKYCGVFKQPDYNSGAGIQSCSPKGNFGNNCRLGQKL
ncbi:tetratricopeptide repeat protein [Algoriphagus boritolerans]|uniref:tetratricopeptide repeat protein n=1 Tax=Algoriphagus boritolerans TaxID=308111 RepID=UPI003A0FBA1C